MLLLTLSLYLPPAERIRMRQFLVCQQTLVLFQVLYNALTRGEQNQTYDQLKQRDNRTSSAALTCWPLKSRTIAVNYISHRYIYYLFRSRRISKKSWLTKPSSSTGHGNSNKKYKFGFLYVNQHRLNLSPPSLVIMLEFFNATITKKSNPIREILFYVYPLAIDTR